jgi:hypothetical protein
MARPRFNANFAARFGETVKLTSLTSFVVYGSPKAQVKDALAGASPVSMEPFGGFSDSDTTYNVVAESSS